MNEPWIDLHTHVLPGLDDGARDLETSLELLRAFYRDGVRTVVATPHRLHPRFPLEQEAVDRAFSRLEAELQSREEEELQVRVEPGAEVRYCPDLPARRKELGGLTLGRSSSFLLLELPFDFLPEELPRVLFELCASEVTPILAHAERYPEYQSDPELLRDAVRRGALVQVTAASVTGRMGRREKKLSHRLLREGLVHVLASDAHDPLRRPPGLKDAVRIASKWLGEEGARALVASNPARILAGEPIPRDH